MKNLLAFLLSVSAGGFAWAQDPSTACLAELKADSRLSPIEGKVPFDVTKGQSLEVLANKAKPNEQEKAALSYMASEGERCLELGTEWRQKNYPSEINALMTTYRVEIVSALADLYAGNITYGELAKFRAKQAADLKNQVEVVAARVEQIRRMDARRLEEAATQQQDERRRAEAQREAIARQDEENRRQAALQILLNRRAYQPTPLQPYQMPVPQTTNCSAYGNQLSCTTR